MTLMAKMDNPVPFCVGEELYSVVGGPKFGAEAAAMRGWIKDATRTYL